MTTNLRRIVILIALALAAACFWYFDITRFTSLSSLKHQENEILAYAGLHPVRSAVWYFLAYILATAVSFPGATVLTLLGGALFGVVWGTIIVSVASTIGASLAFLSARYLLRDLVEKSFKDTVQKMDRRMKTQGGYYLFSLRLFPFVPFFVVNLSMGLTQIGITKFFVISQLGMVLGTVVYVNAGTELAKVETFSDILQPSFLFGFGILSLLPLGAKFIFRKIRESASEQK